MLPSQRPRRAQHEELAAFHGDAYLETLRSTPPAKFRQNAAQFAKYGLDDDCPVFPGLFDFCRLYAGASIEGAAKLNAGQYDVAINWAGGLHHAKKSAASGFCYINDCVLAILELLKAHARVLYIDIDIHHGDGVEEAFYTSDRVMTLSVHMHRITEKWEFFPGTGALEEVGEAQGRGYSVNVPMLEGTSDSDFMFMFKPILARVMEVFDPGAIVLQCGADGLVGDRIGCFNMTVEGHAEAVRLVKSYNVPTLVLGGGGYIKTAVARAWTLGTAALLDADVADTLPPTQYLDYFSPEYKLRYNVAPTYENRNTRGEMERIRAAVLDNLKTMRSAPGTGLDSRPPEALLPEVSLEDEEVVHDRLKAYVQAHYPQHLKCVENGSVDAFDLP